MPVPATGSPTRWLTAAGAATAVRHYSIQAVAVMAVILVVGYLLILRRRRPGDRSGPSRRTDPNRFELRPGPGPAPGSHPSEPTAPPPASPVDRDDPDP